MWAQLRRFNALSGSAKKVFVEAGILLPLLRVSLRMRGFRATQRTLQKSLGGGKSGSNAEPAKADSCSKIISRMVLAAARHSVCSTSCLERSLVLWWLLARQGIASQLRIGVRRTGEKFEAHAWVERDGAAIGEPDGMHLHYAPFAKEFSEELT